MDKITKGRAKIAWLLLITIMPLFIIKTFHYHKIVPIGIETALASQEGHSHVSGTCPICLFSLSPFVESATFVLEVMQYVILVEPIQCLQNPGLKSISTVLLRAPPVLL